MTAILRLRTRTRIDERRWREYARSTTAIFLRWQPLKEPPR